MRLQPYKQTNKHVDFREGINMDVLSSALSSFLHDKVTVVDVYFPKSYIGTLYDTYKIMGTFARNRDGYKDDFKLVAKHYKNPDNATDFSMNYKLRRDLHVYETTVMKSLNDFVPRYYYSTADTIFMEDLGQITLEDIFSDMEKIKSVCDGRINIKFLEDVVTRVAGFHDGLEDIVMAKFKRTTDVDYVGRFDNYLAEILAGRDSRSDYNLDYDLQFRKDIRSAFSVVADIFNRGSISGEYIKPQLIHSDMHPAHIFFFNPSSQADEKLKAFFIDYRPMMGPVQFDLVGFLAHPFVYPYIKNVDNKFEDFTRAYLLERARLANKRVGIEVDATIPKDAIMDFKGMAYLSIIYECIRYGSKHSSLKRKRPEMLDQFKKEFRFYGDRGNWYIGKAIDSLESFIDGGFIKADDDKRKLDDLHKLLVNNLADEYRHKSNIIKKLKIQEEDKI